MDKYENLVEYDITGIERYSFSKLSTYDTCALLYFKTYGKNGDRGKNNGFSMAGSIGHELIDGYYSGEYCDFELKDLFEQRWQTDFLDNGYKVELILPNFKKNLTENYKESFVRYFSNFRAYDNCKIIGTELAYLMLLNNGKKRILFEGIIDGLGIDDNGDYIIWDSKSKGKWKNLLEIKSYAKQLYIYSLFIKKVYGKYPVKLCFNQFRLQEKDRVTSIDFDINDFNESIDWIFETVEKINNEVLWLPLCTNNSDSFFSLNLCNHGDSCEYSFIDRM